MKNLSLILLLSISFRLLLFSQDSIPKEIHSIGKFEINITTVSIFDELQKELKTKIRVCSSTSDYLNFQQSKENSILLLVRDTINKYNSPPQAKYCESVKVYSVFGYSVANIELTGLELTFLNDTLVEFRCDRTEDFIEAVHLKYGKGKLRQTEKDVTCEVGRHGAEVKLKETSFFETWGSSDINATSTLSTYYDRKCEKNYLSYFILYSSSASREISDCEKLKKQEIKKREENQKKKALDGF